MISRGWRGDKGEITAFKDTGGGHQPGTIVVCGWARLVHGISAIATTPLGSAMYPCVVTTDLPWTAAVESPASSPRPVCVDDGGVMEVSEDRGCSSAV